MPSMSFSYRLPLMVSKNDSSYRNETEASPVEITNGVALGAFGVIPFPERISIARHSTSFSSAFLSGNEP